MTIPVHAFLICVWCDERTKPYVFGPAFDLEQLSRRPLKDHARQDGWSFSYDEAFCARCSQLRRMKSTSRAFMTELITIYPASRTEPHQSLEHLPRTYDLPYNHVGLIERLHENGLVVIFQNQLIVPTQFAYDVAVKAGWVKEKGAA